MLRECKDRMGLDPCWLLTPPPHPTPQGQETHGSSMLTSKLLQSSPEAVFHGETASSNGKIPAMPPQQALSDSTIDHDWQLKETSLDGSTRTSPPPIADPTPPSESRRQLTYSFEVDV